MTTKFDKTALFNTTFGNAVRTEPGLHYDDVLMRMGLLLEESKEIETAYTKFLFLTEIRGVLNQTGLSVSLMDTIMEQLLKLVNVEFLDGLVDTQVVLDGLAQATGMPVNEGFEAVFESNMSKLQPDGSVLRREDGKVLKGENYFTPTAGLNKALGYK